MVRMSPTAPPFSLVTTFKTVFPLIAGLQERKKGIVHVKGLCCKYKYIYRSACFTIMAPVRQLICVSYVEKSTNTFGRKMRQYRLN